MTKIYLVRHGVTEWNKFNYRLSGGFPEKPVIFCLNDTIHLRES